MTDAAERTKPTTDAPPWRARILVPASAFTGQPDALDALLQSVHAQDELAWRLLLLGLVTPELTAVAQRWVDADPRIGLEADTSARLPDRLARALECAGLGEVTLVIDGPVVLRAGALASLRKTWVNDPGCAIVLVNVAWRTAFGETWATGKLWDSAYAAVRDLFGPVKVARSDRLREALDTFDATRADWPYAWFWAAAARTRRREIATAAQPLARVPGPPAEVAPQPPAAPETAWPSVTVIVPTRDQLGYLRPCVESVLARTDYPDFELVVVDNASTQPETLSYLDELAQNERVRIRRDTRPFNFSRLNNDAVAGSHSDVVVFLNNDTEVGDPAWLKTLVRPLRDPSVGASGKLLLYPDGTIQHAGVAVGTPETARHIASGQAPDRLADGPGTGRFEVTAVTAACMAIRRALFLQIGGFEPKLAVSYNDVDLCLRLHWRGYRNVCVVDAPLVHHESKSRDSDRNEANRARALAEHDLLVTRWPMLLADGDVYRDRGLRRVSDPEDLLATASVSGSLDRSPS